MNLENIINKAEQLNALAFAIEDAMIAAGESEEQDAMERLHALVYLFQDQLKQLTIDLDTISANIRICNVFDSVRRL